MKKVRYMPSALERLTEVLDFYKKKLSEDQLTELLIGIMDRGDSLGHSYGLGQIEPTLENLELGHRRIIEGHVKIIYRIDGEVVTVIDFFDSRMNPKKVKR
ncbi:MAG: type II toxin-antitoxin system RelE/ParE family toxin [Flavobacteriales bacterium]|nr:type II toxin-antitoxin system RelE/ParE family toxin [Flavobacteriales bacterium]